MDRAELPPEAPGEGPSHLLQLLGAPGVPGLVAASSRLCLCLPGASPLCLGLSSSVSYKDPVTGCRATLLQEDVISDPSLHHTCKDPVS